MYLHFEDWSQRMFLQKLDKAELPHSGKIIKVFAQLQSPRLGLDRPDLTVVSVDGSEFLPAETYDYEGRGSYSGDELEQRLAEFNLGETGQLSVRSLFRFANEHGFCQSAMAARTPDGWLVDHPFGDIDGINKAQAQPEREATIHLDIFFPGSIAVLGTIVDHTRPETMLTPREGLNWRRQLAQSQN